MVINNGNSKKKGNDIGRNRGEKREKTKKRSEEVK
jgi:hypothetical protein